jgi:hypothetical protein
MLGVVGLPLLKKETVFSETSILFDSTTNMDSSESLTSRVPELDSLCDKKTCQEGVFGCEPM